MSIRLRDHMWSVINETRWEPTEKRVRAMLGDEVALDSRRAVFLYEPRRVVPQYAVPTADILVSLSEGVAVDPRASAHLPMLHPGIPFALHSAEGRACRITSTSGRAAADAFRLADDALPDYVSVDFPGFDTWKEEDTVVVGHPRDPYHRVDIRRSDRHVRVELDGEVLADSSRPLLVFETNLPVRFYLPPEDVVAELQPSDKRTYCAYKGEASYASPTVGGQLRQDLVWRYEHPLPDASELAGHLAFFDELVDITVDGEARGRPNSGISAAILDEAGVSSSA